MKRYLFLLRMARFGLMAVVVWCGLSASARPVVFLHGWNSDGEIWKPLQKLLVSDAGYSEDEFRTYSYYKFEKGFDTDTSIETLAAAVAEVCADGCRRGSSTVCTAIFGGARPTRPAVAHGRLSRVVEGKLRQSTAVGSNRRQSKM